MAGFHRLGIELLHHSRLMPAVLRAYASTVLAGYPLPLCRNPPRSSASHSCACASYTVHGPICAALLSPADLNRSVI